MHVSQSIVTNEFHAPHVAHRVETHKQLIQFDRSSACGNECVNDTNLRARLVCEQRVNEQKEASFWTQESIITTNKMILYVHEPAMPQFLQGGMVSTDIKIRPLPKLWSPHVYTLVSSMLHGQWHMMADVVQPSASLYRCTCIGQWHLVSLGTLRRG